MSSTTAATLTSTASSASASSSAHSCPQTWTIPTTDAACAIHPSGNSSDVLKQCCGVASVQSFDDDCAQYCLAQGQDVGSLLSCLQSNGVSGADVFCNSNTSATATAAVSSASSTGSATSTGSGTATGASATSTTTHGAAPPSAKLSAGGVSVLALLFCSALFGALA